MFQNCQKYYISVNRTMQKRCPLGSLGSPVPPVAQKQRVSMGPSRRQKSAYQVQYLEFEKRLASKRRGRLPILGVPSRRSSVRESLNSEEYLALAKQLKHNKKEILFGEDKENLAEPEFDELLPMKDLLDKMKCRYLSTQESGKSRVLQQQYSQQINCLPTQEQESNSIGNRSRALTTVLHPLKDSKDSNNNQHSGIRFLDYKKNRAWMKID